MAPAIQIAWALLLLATAEAVLIVLGASALICALVWAGRKLWRSSASAS